MWSTELALVLFPPIAAEEQSHAIVNAATENIAKGGIGMLCDQPIPPGTVVRCEIALSEGSAHVPTLLRVRWFEYAEQQQRYRVGLQFLI
jgi:c-di-GMP-binding flagellar brake protein YcgR